MTQHRKRRGAKTAALAAEWFRNHGWPFATDVGAGRPGRDIENMPGLAPEVKARRGLDLPGSLRQAVANAGGDLPFVVHRPDGYGPARIADWPFTMRLEDATRLLREAGYGEPEVYEECSDCGKRVLDADLLCCANQIPGQSLILHCDDCLDNCGPCRDEAAREWQEEHGPRSRV